jgi:hypothetical protein
MEDGGRPELVEAGAVWALFGVVGIAVLSTYSRIPPADLYHVSGSGLEGGAARALVFLGYPFSIVAVALAALAAARLGTRAAALVAAAAAVLCATIGIPGVIDQADLDARPVNALAAVGVALALGLAVWAVAREGIGKARPLGRGDIVRAALAAVVLLAGLPWIFAEFGAYVSDAPLLGHIFLAKEIRPSGSGEASLHVVHLGRHHGMDGVLLVLSALALSRVLPQLGSRRLATALTAYLSLMFVYGLANALQDFWTEQLVKRGTVATTIPSVLRPSLGPAWAGILLGAAAIYFVLSRVGRVNRLQGGTG